MNKTGKITQLSDQYNEKITQANAKATEEAVKAKQEVNKAREEAKAIARIEAKKEYDKWQP